MKPPNLDNLTLPGGIVLNFDTGTGMRDLGEIVADSLEIEPKSTEYVYESQRSGKLRPSRVFSIKEEVTMKLKLVEPVIDNLRPFLKGGDITVVGEGSAAAVDQKATLTGALLASMGKYGLTAVTVRQFLDKVFVYDGAAYTDHTAEADTLTGTPFATLVDAVDFLYLGKLTPFKEVYFNFAVDGVYGAVVAEYWDGSAWQTLSVAGAAAALAADGKMNWTIPIDWATTIVNNSEAIYWVRLSATTPWTTPATINYIRQNGVQNTDWILDPGQVVGGLEAGKVGRLSGGFLADGEEVKISYTYVTWESLRFPVATAGFQQGAGRMDFAPATGLSGKYHIPKCQLKPEGALSFDPKKELQLGMILEVLDDYENNPTEPFGYWEALSES